MAVEDRSISFFAQRTGPLCRSHVGRRTEATRMNSDRERRDFLRLMGIGGRVPMKHASVSGGVKSLAMAATLGIAACAAQSGPGPQPPAGGAMMGATAACPVRPVSGCPAAAPSFARDVQPILRRSCFGCHSGDGIAAEEHDFSKFVVLHAQAGAMTDAIATCAMPLRSSLPVNDARILLEWVACGARAD
jgi:hypothetical protein